MFGTNERHNGWYVGGGLDYALTSNVILGLEYQHVFLDSEHHTTRAGGFNDHDIESNMDILRFRLTYKFGSRDSCFPSVALCGAR